MLPILDANPAVNLRYMISASQKLPGGFIPIFANPDDLKKTWQIGYDDAKRAIEANADPTLSFELNRREYEAHVVRDGFD